MNGDCCHYCGKHILGAVHYETIMSEDGNGVTLVYCKSSCATWYIEEIDMSESEATDHYRKVMA